LGKGVDQKTGVSIASHLIEHTLQEAKKSELPVLPFFSDKQVGNNFAERFTHAIDQAFAAGYNRLIVCGTDSPHLNSNQFVAVANKLDHYDIVVGPSEDGGVYLIGLHKASYRKEAFKQIDWHTSLVFGQLKAYAIRFSLPCFVEKEACDIDNAAALYQYKKTFFGPLSLFIDQILTSFNKTRYYTNTFLLHHGRSTPASLLRGPPQLVM
jgi:hypothetical protein